VTAVNAENVKYLRTKQQKMGHWLPEGFDDALAAQLEAAALLVAESDVDPKLRDANARITALDAQLADARAEIARLRALASKANGYQQAEQQPNPSACS
jgi:hypothetical protein